MEDVERFRTLAYAPATQKTYKTQTFEHSKHLHRFTALQLTTLLSSSDGQRQSNLDKESLPYLCHGYCLIHCVPCKPHL